MYRLRDFLQSAADYRPDEILSDELLCTEVGLERTFLINTMQETYGGFSYTLVLAGELTLIYNGTQLTLKPRHLFIYTPGSQYNVVAGTDDFWALALIVDESMVWETPAVRNLIRTAFYPVTAFRKPIVHLTESQALHFEHFLRAFIVYQNYPHRFYGEAMRTLYSLFILDLLDTMEQDQEPGTVNEHSTELFISFMQLLPRHFLAHHDIGFYASELCITTTHLSRVVRQVTGRTVIDYIDHLLLMEAQYLLRSTDVSVTDIAERLHFASQSSFTKFFLRMKGVSPKAYRLG